MDELHRDLLVPRIMTLLHEENQASAFPVITWRFQ